MIAERATCADERQIRGTVATMPALAAAADPKGPCLLLIGVVFAEPAEADLAVAAAEAG